MPQLSDTSCKNWPHGRELRGFLLQAEECSRRAVRAARAL